MEENNPQEPQAPEEAPQETPEEAPQPEETPQTEDDFAFEDDGKGPDDPDPQPTKQTEAQPTDDDQPDIDRIVNERVDAALKPIMEQSNTIRVQNEWTKIKEDWPELSKNSQLEAKILRFAKHESYRNKPVMQAVMDIAGVDLFAKIGAARARQAQQESDSTRGGGGGYTPTGTKPKSGMPSFKGRTAEEIEQLKARYNAGEFD